MAIHTQEISPANGRGELRGFALLSATILLLWALGITLRPLKTEATPLASHQQSAFSSISPLDQGLFNDLHAAAGEIRAIYSQEQTWPDPKTLSLLFIPPFIQDAPSARRGELAWEKVDAHGPTHAIYWGRSSTVEWALIFIDKNVTVWRRSSRTDGLTPQAIPQFLVLDGWTELVPLNAVSK